MLFVLDIRVRCGKVLKDTFVIGWWRGGVPRQSHCRFPKDDVVQAGLDSL